jgi:hypothetical protein
MVIKRGIITGPTNGRANDICSYRRKSLFSSFLDTANFAFYYPHFPLFTTRT